MTGSRSDTSDRLTARLQRALGASEAVRITRSIPGADVLEGFVIASGAKWTLLASLADDFTIDGHIAIRTRQVERVQRHPQRDGATRLLTQRGHWPPPTLNPMSPLDDTRVLIHGLAAQSPTVSLFVETDDPDVCFIGVPVERTDRSAVLDEISPEATWEDTVSRWRYRDITRVDVGCRYEAAPVEAAGPPPTR
ncbi:hypothetical protein [Terrabacter carboxydivorans]|uniref:hypothetical protein n=1 Tax=Terrabacter carboxydivorans TaxID=619730 RepID=UPI0031D936DD